MTLIDIVAEAVAGVQRSMSCAIRLADARLSISSNTFIKRVAPLSVPAPAPPTIPTPWSAWRRATSPSSSSCISPSCGGATSRSSSSNWLLQRSGVPHLSPDAFRVVIVLVEVQGYTYEEVSRLLGVRAGLGALTPEPGARPAAEAALATSQKAWVSLPGHGGTSCAFPELSCGRDPNSSSTTSTVNWTPTQAEGYQASPGPVPRRFTRAPNSRKRLRGGSRHRILMSAPRLRRRGPASRPFRQGR
ncbi:hypothetical protein DSL92_01895 [Billgrantia gudaonensis]|uniref:Uncharacterized protein n=1 Tax=Billgrantia gudaonensis TaxID=376427 RepID=A0A432JL74_9GAMM|nr:hypothetical protein DSL92_01895 [Halomonas gudaonensis]